MTLSGKGPLTFPTMARSFHVRMLLGPAGTGKTHRCLAELADHLVHDPAGPPLLFLAPKQATFQLERQLLEDPRLTGWTRLQILSFDRLARQILETAKPVELLAEEGRVMVLRAILRRIGPQLRVFRSSARLGGFAAELSRTLRELQCHRLGAARLEELAESGRVHRALADKLRDLVRLTREYRDWLNLQDLLDADALPDLAVEALRDGLTPWHGARLWLDGFAEMTPQEIELLGAIVQRTEVSTLAFCLDAHPSEDAPWLSTWAVTSQTFRRCYAHLAALPGARVSVEQLPEPGSPGRFRSAPALAHLATHWSAPVPPAFERNESPPAESGEASPEPEIRLVACRDPESEVTIAARAIWNHVRGGGRFRETAILVRRLEPSQATLERVLLRYRIPYFLDRRESLAHHPLAELTRFAVRLAAFGWLHEDWFGALKTGLTGIPDAVLDRAENEALAHGWDAGHWRLLPTRPPGPGVDQPLETVVPAFLRWIDALPPLPSANELAAGLARLWRDLDVASTLTAWASPATDLGTTPAIHLGAWEQLQGWLENLERGFGDERLALAEWLPILEAGLAPLTAGIIPPAQDQVLVGAIDRSRQPDLRLAIVVGLNEGSFPAPPASPCLLSDQDRELLDAQGLWLGPGTRRRLGHERYLAYVACTRPRERLVLTWAERDNAGRPLNPSPFVHHVRNLFPAVPVESDDSERVPADLAAVDLGHRVQHTVELLPWLLARDTSTPFDGWVGDSVRRAWLRQYRHRESPARLRLHPDLAGALVGTRPEVSVSGLEALAACPFRYFVRHTLRGREREYWKPDPRRMGSLAHELLAAFHDTLTAEHRRWADLTSDEARSLFDRLAPPLVDRFGDGVCHSSASARWHTRTLLAQLRELVALLVTWARKNAFSPAVAELAFGGPAPCPPWSVPLPEGSVLRVRGKVDRVDLHTTPGRAAEFLIIDYKLRPPRVDDRLMVAGIDLQLVAYALALESLTAWAPRSPSPPRAAGMFFVGLRGRPPLANDRTQPVDPEASRARIHVHRGRFRAGALTALDRDARTSPSGQFAFRLKLDGGLRKGGDGREDSAFDSLLDRTRRSIVDLGERLIGGDVAVAPYRLGSASACDDCDLRAVCRFDAWTQPYRSLQSLGD